MLKMSQNSWILLNFKRQRTEFSIYEIHNTTVDLFFLLRF